MGPYNVVKQYVVTNLRLCVTPGFENLAYRLINISDLLLRRDRMKSYSLFIP